MNLLKGTISKAAVAAAAAAYVAGAGLAWAEETIKVGVLHSLSGTMAISETTLKDAMLMLIDEQNEKGGLHARSSWPWLSIQLPIGRSLPRRPAS